MQTPTPENSENPPPTVANEIPTAVRSGASFTTTAFLVLAGFGLLIIFLLKPSSRKTSVPMSDPSQGPEPALQANLPPSLASIQTLVPPAALQKSDGESLQEVRRRSPILIFSNNAAMSSAGTPSSEAAPGLPMPTGFHPTPAGASVHSTALGDREYMIAQGKLLDAVLETAINTDHPGMLRALVSNDIYGDTGRTVLLPRGSRLVGQYDSDVAQGQSRVFVIWQRVIRPDGIDIALDSGGTDPLGQAGVEGKVNRHFFTMFGAATLLSVIGASASMVGVSPQDNNNSLSTYRSSVSQGFNEAANSVLGVFVRIKPTVTVHQGAAIKVFVARDLYFDPAQLTTNRVQVIP